MNDRTFVSLLKKEWFDPDVEIGDKPYGFLHALRYGYFDMEDFRRFIQLLQGYTPPHGDYIHKDVVKHLWAIPEFITGKYEILTTRGYDIKQVKHCEHEITRELERILGNV